MTNMHLDIYEIEVAQLRNNAWDRWVAKAEHLFGQSLDGDEHRDGYSLDLAHCAFKEGQTPSEYVSGVRSEIASLDRY